MFRKVLAILLTVSLIAGPNGVVSVFGSNGQSNLETGDFVPGEVLVAADSLEQAMEFAVAYGAELKSYSYGVAVLIVPNAEQAVSRSVIARTGLPKLSLNRLHYTCETAALPSYDRMFSELNKAEFIRELEAMSDPLSQNDYIESVVPEQYFHEEMDNERAWELSTGEGVTIAVIDTGIDIDHPAFAGRILGNSYNSYTDNVGLDYVRDDNGHGTHVSGIAAASSVDGSDISGVAPDAQILALKANIPEYPDQFESAAIVRAVNYAVENGADIINLSLSRSFMGGPDTLEQQVYSNALAAGIVVVCAAGNDRSGYVDYPAAYPGNIAVSSTRQGGALSYLTNFGPEIELAAPGSDIYSTQNGGGYTYMDGTSMSSSCVTGTAALVKSLYPEYSQQQIKNELYSTARDAGAIGRDDHFGWGIVNSYASLIGADALINVTYDFNDGQTLPAIVKAVSGAKLLEPERLQRPEYAFNGWHWSPDDESPFSFDDTVDSNITLYAHWVKIEEGIYAYSFPDFYFRNYVLDMLNQLDGGERTAASAMSESNRALMASIQFLNVENMSIESLTGIEYFTGLTDLCCDYNLLSELDVSHNIMLETLSCAGNSISALDISQNTTLKYLHCMNNQLTSLDVSNNAVLEHLNCGDNKLETLNINANTNLKYLRCEGNLLVDLDLSGCTALTEAWARYNPFMTSLSANGCIELKEMYLSSNGLTSVDFSDCTALETLFCDQNLLTDIDLTDCTELTTLRIEDNQLIFLDLNKNTELKNLAFGWNPITNIDLSNNTKLEELHFWAGHLTSIDLSKNTALRNLSCFAGELTSLDLSNNIALEYIDCGGNQLTELDVSNNTVLTTLRCDINYMESPDSVNGWQELFEPPNNDQFLFHPQMILGPTLSVSPEICYIPADGGSTEVWVSSTTTWTAVSDSPYWLTVSPSEGTGDSALVLTATQILGDVSNPVRIGTITVSTGDMIQRITVVQGTDEIILEVSPTTWTPDASGDTTSVTVISNSSWSVSSDAESWLKPSISGQIIEEGGFEEGSFTLAVAPNIGTEARTGTVTVSNEAISRKITVTQDAIDEPIFFELSEKEWNPPASGDSTYLTITSNTTWTVSVDADGWLTCSDLSQFDGAGNGVLMLNAEPNMDAEARIGTITVTAGTLVRTVTVTQAAAEVDITLEVSSDTWNPTADWQSTAAISVTSNTSWTADSDEPSWLTVLPSEETGNSGLCITVTQNTESVSRTGTITITAGTLTRTITVTQAGSPDDIILEVSPTTWKPKANGGSIAVKVTSNTNWTAESDADSWLTVSPSKGTGNGSITLTAEQNTDTATRTETITITAGTRNIEIKVTQAAAASNTTLRVSPTTWKPAANGGSTTVRVTSNADWTAESNAESWLTVSPSEGTGNGSITLTAEQNTDTAARTGTITITAGTRNVEIMVTQAAANTTLRVSPTTWKTKANGGSIAVKVTSSTDWTAVSNAESWLTVSPSGGTGNGSISLTAEQNTDTAARTGTITITAGTRNVKIKVTQAAAITTLKASQTTWKPEANGGSIAVKVTSNTDWTAVSNAESWLTVSPSEGAGGGSITLTAVQNTDTAVRTGTITITAGTRNVKIKVTQAAAVDTSPKVSPTTWLPAANGGSKTIKVTSDTDWTAKSNAESWLTISPSEGTGNGSFTLTVEQNTDTKSRTGKITVTMGTISKTVTVTQCARLSEPTTLNISQLMWTPAADGGSTTVSVNSSTEWTALSNTPSWLTISTSGEAGNGSITVTAEQNTSAASRRGIIKVMAGMQTREITVKQDGITNVTKEKTTIDVKVVSIDLSISESETIVNVDTGVGVELGEIMTSVTEDTEVVVLAIPHEDYNGLIPTSNNWVYYEIVTLGSAAYILGEQIGAKVIQIMEEADVNTAYVQKFDTAMLDELCFYDDFDYTIIADNSEDSLPSLIADGFAEEEAIENDYAIRLADSVRLPADDKTDQDRRREETDDIFDSQPDTFNSDIE